MASEEGESSHEKAPDEQVEPEAEKHPRIPPAHEHARWQTDVEPSSAKRALAAHSGLRHPRSPQLVPLKRTEAFQAVYRRGRWAKGVQLSVGVLPNHDGITRVGLRTRRGMKGAVVRNRLKRQIRDLIFNQRFPLRTGLDVVIVIHPKQFPQPSSTFKQELNVLCTRNGSLAS